MFLKKVGTFFPLGPSTRAHPSHSGLRRDATAKRRRCDSRSGAARAAPSALPASRVLRTESRMLRTEYGSGMAKLISDIAQKFPQLGVQAVYGEPVQLDGVTVVPVAATGFGFGA